jgi:uncharacterized protein YceH (UPF0502 family)
MAEVRDPAEVDSALEDLATRPDGPFVKQLPREAGRRDSRYAHLFSGEDHFPVATAESEGAAEPQTTALTAELRSSLQARVSTLEEQVAALRQELEDLRSSIKSS